MPREWNMGASNFCPVCVSVCKLETQGVTDRSPEYNEHLFCKLDFLANQHDSHICEISLKSKQETKRL